MYPAVILRLIRDKKRKEGTLEEEIEQDPQKKDHGYDHPEKRDKNITYSKDGCYLPEHPWPGEEMSELGWNDRDEKTLCWACGWHSTHEKYSAYQPRVRIMHARGPVGLWSIGSRWIVRDELNNSYQGNDYMIHQFLYKQPDLKIPIIKTMYRLSEPEDGVCLTMMTRMPGRSLDQVWRSLKPRQRFHIKNQVADVLRQVRRFTAPFPQKVDGSPLDDVMIGFCNGHRRVNTCIKVGKTMDEWFDSLAPTLRAGLAEKFKTRDAVVLDKVLEQLKAIFPSGEPYVLTHGDLNLSNILVEGDQVTAIIDWEMGGYFPWWAEHWISSQITAQDGSSYQLFQSVWRDINDGLSNDDFYQKIIRPVHPVATAWNWTMSEHPGSDEIWLRPGFCKCQPYNGAFDGRHIGREYEHKVEELDPPIKPEPRDSDFDMDALVRKYMKQLLKEGD